MKPTKLAEEDAAGCDVEVGGRTEAKEEAQKSDSNLTRENPSKSVSFSEEQPQQETRLRGPLVDSSTTSGTGGNLLNRPWPKDVNSPIHRLANSYTTTSSQGRGPCSCFSWSQRRTRVALLGCTSSVTVLIIRLLLDSSPSAYVIHSVIVFLDMILIHLFTFCPWLSVSGEIVTILFSLSFHFTQQKVFELLETTIIAALCSLHMIFSRNKHMHHEHELEDSLRLWHQLSLRSNPAGSSVASSYDALLSGNQDRSGDRADAINGVQEKAPNGTGDNNDDIESKIPIDSLHHSQNRQVFSRQDQQNDDNYNPSNFLRTCGEHFFEHFLDGSAGVMYTSFFGLIIDDLLNYGESKCQ